MSGLSSRQVRRAWSAYACNGKGWFKQTFMGFGPVTIVDVCSDAWKAAEHALVATGYPPAQHVGSYNCRKIAGTSSTSLHAYKLALDLDPRLNYREFVLHWSKHRLTRAQANAVEAIRTVNGKQVFTAGWHFRHHDPMHFQICCTPTDLLTGINYRTVRGGKGDGHGNAPVVVHPHHGVTHAEASRSTLRLTRPYTKGNDVRVLQTALIAHHARIRADGVFGPATQRAVKRFQSSHNLTEDGIVGKHTWKALEA